MARVPTTCIECGKRGELPWPESVVGISVLCDDCARKEDKWQWRVVKNPDQDVVHIIPIGDFEPHDESDSCRCEPERRPVEDGACDLLIHAPYDDSLLDAPAEFLARQKGSE